jgi:acyl-CoA thioesterase-1
MDQFKNIALRNMHVIKLKFKSLYSQLMALIALTLFIASCQNAGPPQGQPDMTLKANTTLTPPPVSTKSEELPVIVAFGDSLTAGFGLREEQSFSALLQRKLDEKGFRYRVINAGVSGDTSAGGVRRIDWSLQGDVKFLILELGANDALRGQPVAETKKNLAQIIERAQARGVTVILAGMEAPPNMGEAYTRAFRQVYRDLADKYKVAFIPFVLEGVGGLGDLNQPDGLHPNAEGEKIMTENVWRVLEREIAKHAK